MLGVLASDAERNKPVRRTNLIWENNIKRDLVKIAWVGTAELKFFSTGSDGGVS
jgi:hypothetical protein